MAKGTFDILVVHRINVARAILKRKIGVIARRIDFPRSSPVEMMTFTFAFTSVLLLVAAIQQSAGQGALECPPGQLFCCQQVLNFSLPGAASPGSAACLGLTCTNATVSIASSIKCSRLAYFMFALALDHRRD